jgi:peptidoglycan hydrolase CwlO-like protein
MFPLFAQAEPGNLWQVVTAFSALAALGVAAITFIRMAGGKANERQIEPTQLAALQAELRANHAANQSELKAQTATLNKLDREVGEIKTAVEGVKGECGKLSAEDANQFKRINAISAESTATKTRVEGLEQRERDRENRR